MPLKFGAISEITSLKQLEKNCKRIIENYSMATTTKQQHIEKMFASYKNNSWHFGKNVQ